MKVATVATVATLPRNLTQKTKSQEKKEEMNTKNNTPELVRVVSFAADVAQTLRIVEDLAKKNKAQGTRGQKMKQAADQLFDFCGQKEENKVICAVYAAIEGRIEEEAVRK